MKTYTIIKVGYSSGVYGCSGEYFQAIIIKDDEMLGICFVGMYGVESRISGALKKKGYIEKYIKSGGYGKITGEMKKYAISENEAIEEIEKKF